MQRYMYWQRRLLGAPGVTGWLQGTIRTIVVFVVFMTLLNLGFDVVRQLFGDPRLHDVLYYLHHTEPTALFLGFLGGTLRWFDLRAKSRRKEPIEPRPHAWRSWPGTRSGSLRIDEGTAHCMRRP